MPFALFWMFVMALAAMIVLGRFRLLREAAEKGGTSLGVREASMLRTLTCTCPLTGTEIMSRLLDGAPAGDLICRWDQDRGAYCFRSELPDGSIPLYCTVEVEPLPEGVRITLTRQKGLLSGNTSVVMRLSAFLTDKLGATDYAWTTDRTMH